MRRVRSGFEEPENTLMLRIFGGWVGVLGLKCGC